MASRNGDEKTIPKRARRRYDDKFRDGALAILEAAGYPDKEGALKQSAKHLKMPITTLHGWWRDKHNPPNSVSRIEKRLELGDMLKAELDAIFEMMPNARQDATYRDLGTVAGILFDKLQLLTGGPTENSYHTVKVERDPDDIDTFATVASGTNGYRYEPPAIQCDFEREAVGQNGTGPKAGD